jgi:hypothetical protein
MERNQKVASRWVGNKLREISTAYLSWKLNGVFSSAMRRGAHEEPWAGDSHLETETETGGGYD